MDGIRRTTSPLTAGLLNTLAAPPQPPPAAAPVDRGVAPVQAPPPPPPPPVQEPPKAAVPPVDNLAVRLQSFRASQHLPTIDHETELRQAVQDVGQLLKTSDTVPFKFDRGAVSGLLSNPTGGPLRAVVSPTSPPARPIPPPPAVGTPSKPSGGGITSVLNLFGR